MDPFLILSIFICLLFLVCFIAFICSTYIKQQKNHKKLTPNEIVEELSERISFLNVNEQKWQTINWNHRSMHIHSNTFVVGASYPYPYTCSLWWLVFESDEGVYCLLFTGHLPNKDELKELIPFRVYKLSQSKINRDSYLEIIDKMTDNDFEIKGFFRLRPYSDIRSILTRYFRHEL